MTDGAPSAECHAPRAWILVGPTASGKSAVAQYIAERHGQLIVSADAMNLYRGMDIGTAKPSVDERAVIDYAGIDIADPTDKFSVAAYLEAVRPAFKSGREIIVTGGTGLYVKCLTDGFDDVPPENEALRSDIPTLILTGDLDPVTPPSYGEKIAETLPNATHAQIPFTSHGVFSDRRCARQLAASFLDDPTAPLDLSCVDQLRAQPPVFATR